MTQGEKPFKQRVCKGFSAMSLREWLIKKGWEEDLCAR